MKVIDRYILWEMFKIFALSVCTLTLILFLDKFLFLTELIVNKGVTFLEVVKMMAYISPAFLALTIPMSTLVGSTVVFSQLSGDSELIAMRSNGMSFLHLMRPVMMFSILAYLMTNVIMFYALPWGNFSFKKLVFEIVQTRANIEIKPSVFNKDFDHLVLFVKEKEKGHILRDIFIADTSEQDNPKIIVAQEGVIASDPEQLKIQLQLKNGTIHGLAEQRKNYQLLNFTRYDLTLDLPSSNDMQKGARRGNRELSLDELREKIKRKKSEGEQTFNEEVELSKKFSLPFTCLVFAFIGAPLGVTSARSGRSGSFAISAAVIGLYYIGLISTQNLGSVGKLPPLLSVWIPNFIAASAALYLVFKMQKEIPFRFYNWLEEWTVLVYQYVKRTLFKTTPGLSLSEHSPVHGKQQKEIDEAKRKILARKLKKLKMENISRQMSTPPQS